MKKLLHERLRDYQHRDDESPQSFCQELAGKEFDHAFNGLRTTAMALADEIEANYAPLPRDKEGKPWNIGDETTFGTIDSLMLGKNGWTALVDYEDECFHCNVEKFERPEPKVLDAGHVTHLSRERHENRREAGL